MSLDLNSIVPQFNIKMANLCHKMIYEFENFRLDTAHLMLYQNEQEISLAPKDIETLLYLVERRGEVLGKDELMKLIWADSIVEEGNLSQNLYLLRKTLGVGKNGKSMIETLRGRGYRFVPEVRRIEEEAKPTYEESAIHSEGKQIPAQKSPRLVGQTETKTSGAVVALADWRHETDKNQPEESNGQPAKLKLAPTNPVIKSKPKYHAFALIAVLVGAVGLGYYFFSAGKPASSADGIKSIAVLPIKPINTANRDEIYEIGIANSLIYRLSSMKGFIVRPLSATRKYADIEQDSLVAGREQQVDYVLASNYQLANGKIRITAQLFNVASGQVEETYKSEKDASDVFAMQDAVAGEVGNILSARFATTSSSPTAKRGTTNEEAFRLYLQGRNLTYNRAVEYTRKAVEYFERAIKLDPNFAPAYSGMAHAFIASGNLGGDLPPVEYEKARAAVTRALELDNNLAEAYAVSGELKFTYEWDFAAAEKDLLRAIELEPNSDLAHKEYAWYLAARGRFGEAITEAKTAQEINPGSIAAQQNYGRILYLARRYDEAIIQFKQIVEVKGGSSEVYYGYLWLANEMKGDIPQTYKWFMECQKQNSPENVELYRNAYETSGWRGVRQKFFALQKLNERKPSANLYAMARQCALLGEKEQAFEYLNKAIEKRQGQLVQLNVEPSFDILRDDLRFDELVRRVGLK